MMYIHGETEASDCPEATPSHADVFASEYGALEFSIFESGALVAEAPPVDGSGGGKGANWNCRIAF